MKIYGQNNLTERKYVIMKKSLFCALLLSFVFSKGISDEKKAVLDLPLDKYPSSKLIKGGTLDKVPPESAFRKISGFPCLDFNGRDEILEIKPLDEEAKKTLKDSFTLEFDFFMEKLPMDKDYYDHSACRIDIFSAPDASGKTALNFKANEYNRFTASLANCQNKFSSIFSTWNNKKNYEITSIIRGKWYEVSLVYNKEKGFFELYLDNELAGKIKTFGEPKEISSFIFGGEINRNNCRNIFKGGIRNIKLYKGALHDEKTSEEASEKAWKRLHDSTRDELSKCLPPENPQWLDNHPRMLLTPTRIEALKAALKKGKGPELMARLIKKCDAMIDPESPEYLKEVVGGHDMRSIMRSAVLSLATLLTGNEKYALHAAKVVTEYTESIGYNDMTHQLVMSAGYAKPLLAIALTYDWAYKYLTQEQRRKIRLFLYEMAKGTYDFYNGSYYSTAKRDALSGWVANWTALSESTLGNASLAILGETGGVAVTWLNYAKFRAMQYGMFAVGMNGCFHEMPAYLAFGAGPIILFMESLYTAGGEDLLMASNFSKTPDFLAYLIYPYDKKTMPLKYSREINGLHRVDSYVMALLRKKLGSQAVEWDWQKLYGKNAWAENWSLFNLIWFESEKKKLDSPGLPLAKWFKSEGLAAFRSDWSKDAIAGIFMAYPAKIMAHDQSDRGQFNLYGYQGRWIIDNGGRGQKECAHRDAHNLITIDNNKQCLTPMAGHNYHLDAFLTNFCHIDSLITAAEADLADSYRYICNWQRMPVKSSRKPGKDEFKEAERKILFMREKSAPPYLLVFDKIQQDDKERLYTLNLHTAPENEVKLNKTSVEFHQYPEKVNGKISYVSRPVNKDGSSRYYYSGHPNAGYAEYYLEVPEDGEYDLYGFGRPGDKNPGGMDSFFVCLGGEKMYWGTNAVPEYRWSKINQKALKLKKGKNTLGLYLREPEARAAKFAVCPAGNIPLFNNPEQPGLVLVDAGKPDKIVNDFITGQENMSIDTPEAFMTLHQLYPDSGFEKKVFKGSPMDHFKLETSAKTVEARFLNFFYPYKPGMQKSTISKPDKNISLIKWDDCEDVVCLNLGNGIEYRDFKTDSDFAVIRTKNSKIIAFAIVNGTYLKYNNKNILTLSGGPGIASWSADEIVISGKNVYNFKFNFPKGSEGILKSAKAQGKQIKISKTENGWEASELFVSRNVLSW